MALQPLLQKLLALRGNDEAMVNAFVGMAAANIHMANRLVRLELAGIGSGVSQGGAAVAHLSPEGYALGQDLRVTPVTLARTGGDRLPGAALTMVLGEINNSTSN